MRIFFPSLFVLLLSLPAWASVGTVTALEGHATRTPANGAPVALAQGTPVEELDTLKVQDGALEITLEDDSVLALSAGAELQLTRAVFHPEERTFLGSLRAGSLWTSVRKTLEGEKSRFEVTTDRAVAGVRGTVFRMDVAEGADGADTLVSVEEGQVQVDERAEAPPSPPMVAAANASSPQTAPAGAATPVAAAAPPLVLRSQLLGANTAWRVGHHRFERFTFRAVGGSFERFLNRRRARALQLRLSTPKYWRRKPARIERRIDRIERRRQRRER